MTALSLQRQLERVARIRDGCDACARRVRALRVIGASDERIREAQDRLQYARLMWRKETAVYRDIEGSEAIEAALAGRLPCLRKPPYP